MILTEEEARTKWCPFVRLGHGYNRLLLNGTEPGKVPHTANCIASDCMAWQVVDDGHDRIVPPTTAIEFELITQGYVRVPAPDVGYSKPGARPPTGCCGLAERVVTVVQEAED